MRSRTIGAVATLAVAGTATLAATGEGAPARGPERLALIAVDQRCAGVDAGKRPDHLGALVTCDATVRRAGGGEVAGRARWLCTYLGSEDAGDDCVATVTLERGTLRVGGILDHTRADSAWVVTGGTGRFAGARGTMRVRQIDDDRTAATIALLR